MLRFETNYTISDKLRKLLTGLNEAFTPSDQRSVLTQIGQIYLDATKKRFETQTDVDRKKWKPLRPDTIRKKGHSRIGVLSGDLRNSIKMEFTGNSVFIGTDVIYAKTFHYFVKKGSFGKGIPWGDIPRRSFIGRNNRIDDQVVKKLKQIYAKQFGLDVSSL
jgi:phage gpG-like protein